MFVKISRGIFYVLIFGIKDKGRCEEFGVDEILLEIILFDIFF